MSSFDDDDDLACEVLRQVEYYFSDENLGRPDQFLRDKMKRANKPVALDIICGFKQMRKLPFKQAEVETILRDSEEVDLVQHDGKTCIQRKVPFQWPPPSKKRPKPTGFEDNFVDPPTTPQEAVEEHDLYSLDQPFAQRIETALQRYQTRRRFAPDRRVEFDKWLRYGGLDIGPKQFSGGMDQDSAADLTAAEIRVLTTTVFVPDDRFYEGEDARWVVDFVGVAQGYLSSVQPYVANYNSNEDIAKCKNEIKNCTQTLRNFYQYLLLHDVCPEYKEDILAAREICDTADLELFQTAVAMKHLPGEFNMACSILFGDGYKNCYVSGQAWSNTASTDIDEQEGKKAQQIFEVVRAAVDCSNSVTSTTSERVIQEEKNVGLEVVGIDMIRHFDSDKATDIKPIGKLICKPWQHPDFDDPDLPKGLQHQRPPRPETYEFFFLEQDILDNCFVGMKILASVYTLSSGITFLDTVSCVMCSFHTVLPNEILRMWTEPKWVTREEYLAKHDRGGEGEDDRVGDEAEDLFD